MDEKQLIASAQAGDAGALNTLLRQLEPKLYRFSLRMCGRVEDAEDALQETLMAVVRGLPSFRGESSLSTWGYTIARRICTRARSREMPTESADAEEFSSDHDPAAEASRARQWAKIRAAVLALETGQREVFVLRDIEGLSAKEVGEVLDLGVPAVKSRLHRARARVRQLIAKDLGEPAPGCPNIRAVFSSHLEGDLSAGRYVEMASLS